MVLIGVKVRAIKGRAEDGIRRAISRYGALVAAGLAREGISGMASACHRVHRGEAVAGTMRARRPSYGSPGRGWVRRTRQGAG
jgi:hypothetical protein